MKTKLTFIFALITLCSSFPQNFFPLHGGDKLHFQRKWAYQFGSSVIPTVNYDKYVVDSMVIGSLVYFKLRNYWYTYNQQEQKLYILNNNQPTLAVDFACPSGSTFVSRFDNKSRTFESYGVTNGYYIMRCDYHPVWYYRESSEIKFKENLGYVYDQFYTANQNTNEYENSEKELIEYITPLDTFTFAKPQLTINVTSGTRSIVDFPFNINYTKTHIYPELIDTIGSFIKVIRNDSLVIERFEFAQISPTIFAINLLPSELHVGDVIKLNFLISDSSFVRNKVRMPESGTIDIVVTGIPTNNGWIPYVSSISSALFSVQFNDQNIGWIVGEDGTILKTTNKGESWFSQSVSSIDSIRSVFFIDSSRGWIVGNPKKIFKTSNGGSSWSSQLSGVLGEKLNSVYFINSDTGFAVGTDLYRTNNGGVNWVEIPPGLRGYNSIYFVNPVFGGAVGYDLWNITSFFARTTNRGNSWTQTPGITSTPLMSIFFIDENIGWTVGWNGIMLKTTNGGINWVTQPTVTASALYSIYFNDNNTGYVVGENGTILKTTDGGSTWIMQVSGTTANLNSVYFVDSNNGWTVGNGGEILKTTNGGVTFVEENGYNQPKNFTLDQNYPNPFNPSTKISWQSPVSSWQTLKVYDILGNEVVTLVNEEKSPGNYEVTWNAAGLPSGVYFYQLHTGSLMETKKMVLLR